MAKRLDWDKARRERGQSGAADVDSPATARKSKKEATTIVQRLHDHFVAARGRAANARAQSLPQIGRLSPSSKPKKSPAEQAPSRTPRRVWLCPRCRALVPTGDPDRHLSRCSGSATAVVLNYAPASGQSPGKRRPACPGAAKKSEKKRRSVWTVSGGSVESNRRRH